MRNRRSQVYGPGGIIVTVVVIGVGTGVAAGLMGGRLGLSPGAMWAIIAPIASLLAWGPLARRRPAPAQQGSFRAGTQTVLLEAENTARRLVQTILPLAGTILGATGVALLVRENGGDRTGAAVALLLGVTLIVVAVRTVIRWDASYQGHTIRLEIDPCFGERLFIDGTLAARGRFGQDVTMRATIETGEGAGDAVVATSWAGLVTFSCRIVIESPRRSGS